MWEGAILRGEGAAHCEVWGDFVVTCAKTAEPIVMPFGLWARTGPRNHELDGVQIPLQEGAICGKWLPIVKYRHSAVSCAEAADPIDLQFELWTRVGRRKHRFNRVCQMAQMHHFNRIRQVAPAY